MDKALFWHTWPSSCTLTSTGTHVSAGCSCYSPGSSIPGKMSARDCAGAAGALRPHILHRGQAEEQPWHLASCPATSLLPKPLPCAGRKQLKSAPAVHSLFAPVLGLLFTCFTCALSLLCYSQRGQSAWMVVTAVAQLFSSLGYPLCGIGEGIFSASSDKQQQHRQRLNCPINTNLTRTESANKKTILFSFFQLEQTEQYLSLPSILFCQSKTCYQWVKMSLQSETKCSILW